MSAFIGFPLPEKGDHWGKGLMVYPTETFYALGAKATDEKAIEKIYQLKRRSHQSPLLVLVSDWQMLFAHVEKIAPKQEEFLRRHWPGPLTVILKPRNLARGLNHQGEGVGFRLSSSDEARELIRRLRTPLVGTSANPSGMPPASSVQEAYDYFGEDVPEYFDGGPSPGGEPSSLIRFRSTEEFEVLRSGKIRFSSTRI